MKPYHKIPCQRRVTKANPAVLSSQLWKAVAWVLFLRPQAMCAAMKRSERPGVTGATGLALSVSKRCLLYRLSLRTASGPLCKAN